MKSTFDILHLCTSIEIGTLSGVNAHHKAWKGELSDESKEEVMENQVENLGQEAVSGIQNIERWRNEIEAVAKLILSNINMKSLFTEKKLQGYKLSANSSTNAAGNYSLNSWSLKLYCDKDTKLELSVGFFSGMHVADISLKQTNIPAGVVQAMRERLSALIEMSQEAFPELKEKLEPFIEAGKVKT